VRFVKTKNHWVCDASQYGGKKWRHQATVFPEPKIEVRPDTVTLLRLKREAGPAYEERSAARWQAWLASPEYQENQRLAALLSIEETKRYLRMEDVKTLCRSCAASEDYHHILRSELGAV